MRIFIYFARFQKLLIKLMPLALYNKIRRKYKKILYLYYSGNKFACPFCGGHYKKFLSYGRIPRPNVRCPYDDSLGRHRLLWIYLMKEINFYQGSYRLLHFAPEDCFQNYFKTISNLQYVSADLNSPKAMIKMNITNIKYKTNSFDFIICLQVLEHVLDDTKAMRELCRVLKPGGIAFLQFPINYKLEKTFEDETITSPEDRVKFFGQSDHVRIYGPDFKERLKSAGFHVNVEKCSNFLSDNNIKKFALNRSNEIIVCTKLK